MSAAPIHCGCEQEGGEGYAQCIFQRGEQSTTAEWRKTNNPANSCYKVLVQEIATVPMTLLAGEIMKCVALK